MTAGSRGFGLVEALVALAITGLVITLAVGLGGRIADVRGRIGVRVDVAARDRVAAAWFRETVESVMTDPDDPGLRVEGSVTRFAAVSAHLLDRPPGVTDRFAWEIRRDPTTGREGLVWIGATGTVWPVATWETSGARLAYLGPDLSWTETWDSATAPRLVRLWFGGEGTGRVWLGAPRTAR